MATVRRVGSLYDFKVPAAIVREMGIQQFDEFIVESTPYNWFRVVVPNLKKGLTLEDLESADQVLYRDLQDRILVMEERFEKQLKFDYESRKET